MDARQDAFRGRLVGGQHHQIHPSQTERHSGAQRTPLHSFWVLGYAWRDCPSTSTFMPNRQCHRRRHRSIKLISRSFERNIAIKTSTDNIITTGAHDELVVSMCSALQAILAEDRTSMRPKLESNMKLFITLLQLHQADQHHRLGFRVAIEAVPGLDLKIHTVIGPNLIEA